jgi:hypothetical protein
MIITIGSVQVSVLKSTSQTFDIDAHHPHKILHPKFLANKTIENKYG